jgi:SH3 domain protein
VKRPFRVRALCVALLSISLIGFDAGAQTRYVSDDLVITFRTGPGSEFQITRNLTSGDRVEVLEESSDEEYSHVRLSDGTDGWVLSRYLQSEPTAQLRLNTATQELERTKSRADELAQRVTELESQLESTQQALSESQSSAEAMQAELAEIRSASAGAIETRDENEQLRNRVAKLTSEADVAEMEIDELRRRERQNWFIVGAAVLFGGIVIGLVAPSLRRRRRSTW